jgi:hypothetical protein
LYGIRPLYLNAIGCAAISRRGIREDDVSLRIDSSVNGIRLAGEGG